MTSSSSPTPSSVPSRISIAIVAALPFVLLQLVFLSDSFKWSVFLFGYMGIVLAAPIVFFCWCVYCVAEYRLRLKTKNRPTPAFAFAGGVLLIGFFLPSMVIHPVLLKIPYFCRITQSVLWSTSLPDARWDGNHYFALVLIGKGTEASHTFTAGRVTWSGDEHAGFSSVDFQPVSFQEQYREQKQVGELPYLKSRMTNSGIPDDELETISMDLWQVLNRVEQGQEIRADSGVVDEIECTVDDGWDSILGGWIWILCIIAVFLLVSRYAVLRVDE